jgi:hypothetical protein
LIRAARPAPPGLGRRLVGRCVGLALASVAPVAIAADQSVSQFWPELNATVRLSDQSRLFFLASVAQSREFATSTESSYGVHYDWFAASLPAWWLSALPDMDQRWALAFRFGVNRIEALGTDVGDENRLLADVTLRSEPLVWGLQVANRNRIEFRDINGDGRSWRYRNRSRLERGFTAGELVGSRIATSLESLGLRSVTPYAMLEFFYDSRVYAFNRRSQQYGVELELKRGYGLEFYVAIQDQNREAASQVVAFGAVLALRY